MARIRSLKPEAFASETLAEVSMCAERTLFGLSTIADDRGRVSDKPAQINGELWSMRGNHSKDDLESELLELEKVGLVCRYTGCDGKHYLHLVSWDRHQKIDHPSKVRLPRCPHHPLSVTGRAEQCGLHDGNCPARETLASPREDSRGARPGNASTSGPGNGTEDASVASRNGTEDTKAADQQERDSSRDSREESRGLATDLGPRTVDLGSGSIPPTAGAPQRTATARKPRKPSNNAADVIAAFVDGALAAGLQRPPEESRNRVGKAAKSLLAQDYPLEKVIESGRNCGAAGHDNLVAQWRKDDKTASNGSAGTGKKTNYSDEEYHSGW